MSTSGEEFVKLKLITLTEKLVQALEHANKLQKGLESSSNDTTSLNVIFDNLHVSIDQFLNKDNSSKRNSAPPSGVGSNTRTYTGSKATSTTGVEGKQSKGLIEEEMKIETKSSEDNSSKRNSAPPSGIGSPTRSYNGSKASLNAGIEGKQSKGSIEEGAVGGENDKSKHDIAGIRETLNRLQSEVCTVFCENAELKKRLTCVEQQRGNIMERICELENNSVVAFGVYLQHRGPWKNGAAIRRVECVDFNIGDAFQENTCQFLVPVDGFYCLILYAHITGRGNSRVELWTFDGNSCIWNNMICSVCVNSQTNNGRLCDVVLVHLQEGDAVRTRVYEGGAFYQCNFQGWLVSAGCI